MKTRIVRRVSKANRAIKNSPGNAAKACSKARADKDSMAKAKAARNPDSRANRVNKASRASRASRAVSKASPDSRINKAAARDAQVWTIDFLTKELRSLEQGSAATGGRAFFCVAHENRPRKTCGDIPATF